MLLGLFSFCECCHEPAGEEAPRGDHDGGGEAQVQHPSLPHTGPQLHMNFMGLYFYGF